MAGLGRDVERAVGGGGDLVQVEVVLAVNAPRRPGVAAVAGGEQRAVGADGEARLGVARTRRRAAALGLGRGVDALPGRAAVPRAEDDLVVAHRPAEPGVVHPDAGEQGPGRHVGLASRSPRVAGDEDVPALAHGHQRGRRCAATSSSSDEAASGALTDALGAAAPACPAGAAGREDSSRASAAATGARAGEPHGASRHGQRTPSRRSASGVKSASVRFRLKSCGAALVEEPHHEVAARLQVGVHLGGGPRSCGTL